MLRRRNGMGPRHYPKDRPLTRRQREIVLLIRKRLQNKEIAKQLNLSVYTVKNHVSTMLLTYGLKHRWQLVSLLAPEDRPRVRSLAKLHERLDALEASINQLVERHESILS